LIEGPPLPPVEGRDLLFGARGDEDFQGHAQTIDDVDASARLRAQHTPMATPHLVETLTEVLVPAY
jgi:hypothetical protein